ncbi:restriction endonuclease subunit S [Corynebacterium tuberculostearicum]
MLNTTIEEAFEINPTITIKRDAEVPFVSMDRLTPGQRDVDAGEIRQFRSGSKFAAGDTLMARITPCLENKKIARYLPNDSFNKIAAGSTEFIVLRGKPGRTTTEFSYYFAITPTIHETAIALMTGTSGRQRVDMAAFRAQEVEIPELAEQPKITDLLGALDDKIVANQTSISKIDEILRALWQKELSLGNIDVPLSSLASFINGKAFTKGASGTGRVVVRIAEMNSGIGGKTVFSDFDADPDNEVNPGDLLFSWSGTLMTKRWPYDQAIVNQHIFKVVPNGQLDLWALRQAIDAQLEYFQMIAAGKATTMGHIKRGDLDQEVKVPAQMSEETNQLGNSLWGLATSLEIQNLQLARTRDELLPLLMSGRITVGEAEDAADEAASES